VSVDKETGDGSPVSDNKSADTHGAWTTKEKFTAAVAVAFIFLLIGMMMYLTYVPLPPENRDPILMFVSSFLTTGAMAGALLFGGADEDKKRCEESIAAVKKELGAMEAHYQTQLSAITAEYKILDQKYDKMLDMLVQRHVVDKEGIQVGARNVL
jgi:hypothetical protein